MGFELTGGDAVTRLKLRAHVDSIRAETTSPGLSTTTQVIVVDPMPPMRARMARALESAGFKITPCASATEALDACAVWRPDVIVSAQNLGGMTGTDLAYAMTEHTTLSDVPLILTGDDGDLGRLEAYRAGVRDYVPRPFLDQELVIRVHRVVAPTPASNSRPPRQHRRHRHSGRCSRCSSSSASPASCCCCVTARSTRVFVADGHISQGRKAPPATACRAIG